MPILYDRIDPACSFLPSHEKNGKLPLKIHEFFQNPSVAWLGDRPHGLLNFHDIGVPAKNPLTFPVVAGRRRLAHGRDTKLLDKFCELIGRLHRGEGLDGEATGLQKLLLIDPILNDPEHGTGRANPTVLFQPLTEFSRHILPFKRHRMNGVRKLDAGGRIRERRGE
jgi:hypothetical protein